MTTSRRLADRKVERFEKNIKKRGAVPESTAKKGSSYPVGPMVIGFFIFVVIGSYVEYDVLLTKIAEFIRLASRIENDLTRRIVSN